MIRTLIAALALAHAAAPPPPAPPLPGDYRARLPEDEVIYFLLPDRFDNADPANDRGGLEGDQLATGFDPTDKGFWHGGDLKGVTRRLGYLQDLGATAIWVGPIFRNKVVQGAPGHESAGYHGYWITDFTHVDPHLGTDADFAALVAAAHARGMKVYMDIIANHTADVIRYRECPPGAPCPYRSVADYPYTRAGGVGGRAINTGFAGDDDPSAANWARLTDPRWAYSPYVPAGEEHTKTPAWLNDLRYYHNRGDTTYRGESATYGDFAGLDDLATEDPRVVAGMIRIFGDWIGRYRIDGFRIDTARHVDAGFWRAFVPAMLARAQAAGIPNFHIFGEAYYETLDVGLLARHTIVDGYPAVLDFAFRQAVLGAVAGKPEADAWVKLANGDALYAHGFDTARILPTFVSNHDAGRIGHFVRAAHPHASDGEVLARVMLAHAMLLTWRGVPTIYSGDEQGFAGHGGDQDARADMFASRVPSYTDETVIGGTTTGVVAHWGEDNPIFREIAALSRLRRSTPALTRGRQLLRTLEDAGGLVAVSRFDPATDREVLVVYNTAAAPVAAQVRVEARSRDFDALAGACAPHASAPGSVAVALPAFGYAVCAAR